MLKKTNELFVTEGQTNPNSRNTLLLKIKKNNIKLKMNDIGNKNFYVFTGAALENIRKFFSLVHIVDARFHSKIL